MSTDVDAIVIGSGFGGAVCPARLSVAGYRVLRLERGRRWESDTYPRVLDDDCIWGSGSAHLQHGWFDFRVFPNMAVVQGAGVGGGSLVYATNFRQRHARNFPQRMSARDQLQPAAPVLRACRRDARRAEGTLRSVARAHAPGQGGRPQERLGEYRSHGDGWFCRSRRAAARRGRWRSRASRSSRRGVS